MCSIGGQADIRLTPNSGREADMRQLRLWANSGLIHRSEFVLFTTSLPRLSIGCAIIELIATAVSNHAGRPADVWSNADS